MKVHEHIIRASIPELSFVLTREELARGIADFARHPENFIDEVSGSRLTTPEKPGKTPGSVTFSREISFGTLRFVEEIELSADGNYHAHNDADGPRPASDFRIEIEEPEKGSLFLRFTYHEDRETPLKESAQEAQISQLRRLAYESKDRSILVKILNDLVERHAGAAHA